MYIFLLKALFVPKMKVCLAPEKSGEFVLKAFTHKIIIQEVWDGGRSTDIHTRIAQGEGHSAGSDAPRG